MAHFALLWKARTVEKYRLKYENEKINSIAMADIELPKKTVLQKWRHYRFDTQKRISKTFRQLYPEGSSVSNFITYLRTKQTYTNILVKATFGFVGGYVLSYLCYIFFVYQLSISVVYATVLSFIIGILLTLGLAFSCRIRCLVFLLIPQFFSRFGRYTLTCFALVLILTGPATNTLKNSEVLSESMACSQEQIKTSLNNLNESMKKPHNFLKDSIKLIVEKTKKISFELKEVMLKINKLILTIVSAIQINFAWLKFIAVDCNHKLGTPYQHCTRVLKHSITYCEEVFGAISRLCDVTYLARDTCADTKPFEAFCRVSEFVDDCFLATIRRRLKDFFDRIKAMMEVKVNKHHSYLFNTNASSSASQVAAGIVTEIRNRADPLLTWLSWSSCVTSLFLLLIIFRAKYYQHMYETRSRFDNRYVTKELRDLDLKRLREGRETILPLNRREKAKYINITSFRLLTSERKYWSRSVVFMIITTFKLLIHMVADYSLYWVLVTIRYHGSSQTPLHGELPRTGFHVSNVGFVARFIKSMLSVLEIPLANTDSSASCLPNPNPPDFRRYTQIGVIIFMLWFFALLEPYGLRLRHVIMTHYRPERARERAVWLYNHILRTRGSFLKFARRKLHREYKYRAQTKSTFPKCICAYLPFGWLRSLLGVGFEEVKCLLCGATRLKSDPDSQIIRCESTDCAGTYCSSCFAEIGQLCTICLSPEDYGDTSDVSLERGSSGENSESDDDNGEIKKSRSNTVRRESVSKTEIYCFQNVEKLEINSFLKLQPKLLYKVSNKDKKNKKSIKYCNQDDDKFPLLHYTGHKIPNIPENKAFEHRWYKNKYNTFVADNNVSTLKVKQVSEVYKSNMRLFYVLNKRAIYYSLSRSPYFNRKYNKNVVQFYKIHDAKYFATNKMYDFDPDVMIIKNTKYINGIAYSKAMLFLSSSTALMLSERFNFYEVKKTSSLTIIRRTSRRCLLPYVLLKRRRKERKRFKDVFYFIKLSRNFVTQYPEVNNSISTLCFGNKTRNSKNVGYTKRDKKKTNKKQKKECNNKDDDDNELKKGNLYRHVRRLLSLNTLWSTYWNNMKLQVTSCNNLCKVHKKLPSCNQKKNHKRRKKIIRIFQSKKNENIEQKDNIDAGNFRISTYFFDQEWFKRKYEVNSINSKKILNSNKTSKSLEEFTSDNLLELKAPSAIQIARCTSSGMLKMYDPKTDCPCINDNNDPYQLKNQRRSKLDITKKALERFHNRIVQRLRKDPSTKNVVGNLTIVADVTRERVGGKMLGQTNSNTNRRVNYFRSNKVNDNVDTIYEDDLDTEDYAEEGASEFPFCDNCKLPVVDSSKTSKGSSTIDIIGNKSNKCSCNKLKKGPRIKTPLKCMRELCVSLFGSSADEETSSFRKGNKANKGVNVITKMKSCCCQHTPVKLIQDHSTQVGRTPTEILHNAATSNINPTCTCATQRVVTNRDVGTWLGHHCNELHRAATEHKRKMMYEKSDLKHAYDQQTIEAYDGCYNVNKGNADSITDTNDSSTHESLTCLKSESSIESNGSKTDTTICSVATVDYREESRNKKRKTKTKVVTKTNRSTLTEKAKVCDVSTITNDWWSPIMERKESRVEKKTYLKKKKGDCTLNEAQKQLTNRGMTTEGKIVTFKSRTHVIPPGTTDIMSPSRYLLESQKYYNELFSSKFYTPHMYMLTQAQKHQESDKNHSPTFIRHHTRRGHKNKTQDESYSKGSSINIVDVPRKRVQTNMFKQNKLYRSTPRPHYGKKPKVFFKNKHGKEAGT